MKISVQNVVLVLAMAACASILRGQAVVEYGLGAARAATTAAGANEAGKGVAGAFANLDKALKPAKSEAGSTTTTTTTVLSSKDADAPKKTYEDISKAEAGLTYDDLVRRFGPPSNETSGAAGKRVLTYGRYGLTKVEVVEGKVTAVNTVKQQGVFTLPGK